MPVKDMPGLRHDRSGAGNPIAFANLIALLIADRDARKRRGNEPEGEPVRSPNPKPPLLGGAVADR
ncbi:MAG: hypothetical protein ABI810_03730 [Sphingomonas bacterium]